MFTDEQEVNGQVVQNKFSKLGWRRFPYKSSAIKLFTNKKLMLRFHKTYCLLTLLLLLVEIAIALFVNDKIIRPYIGDLLVVVLLYCFVKSFLTVSISTAAIAVLLFAYFVEALQYIGIVQKLGLQNNRLAVIMIGASFEWMDLLMYTAGIILVVIIEKTVRSASAQ
jgi:hypothetical protein